MGLEGIVGSVRTDPMAPGDHPNGSRSEWIKVKNPNAPALSRVIELGVLNDFR
jgi:hypothetical protein